MYVYGNPVRYIDPSGLQTIDDRCNNWSSSFWTPENLQYDKCVELSHAFDTNDTSTIKSWYNWLWTEYSSGTFEYASELGMHFLGNTGDDFEMSEDFAKAVKNLNVVKSSVKDHKNWYITNYIKPVASTLAANESAIFGRDKFKNGIAINGVDPYWNAKIFLTWNEFKIDVEYQGTVTSKETWFGRDEYLVELNILYRAHDEYDWHPGLSIPNPYGGRIWDDWAYLLDEQGCAEHFESYFEWSETLKKTYNNRSWPSYNNEWK
jgi:hypothetical protein